MGIRQVIKTGSVFFWLVLIMGIAGGVNTAIAQDVEVEAALSETNIFKGEQVRLELSISGNSLGSVTQPELPEIDGLRWLRGNTRRSTNYSLINGKPSVTYTFGYTLIAREVGEYTVPAIEVPVDGTIFKTEPLSFKILDPSEVDNGEEERTPDIYVRIEPDNKNPVVGQQIIADVVLYFKRGVEVTSYQPSPGWKAEGFWKEDLEYPRRAQSSSTLINGVRYQRARLLQYAIFPTKTGELTLSPFEINVSIRPPREDRDPFGFGMGQKRMVLETQPVTITAERPPELQNEEVMFTGAVGDFTISRDVSSTNVLVGESIEVTTTIRGTGNIPLINKPEYGYPDEVEQYNPQQSTDISRNNSQITGTRTFTDILIARNAGEFEIPETKLAYFNPEKKDYEIISLPGIAIEAERDPDAPVLSENNLKFDVSPVKGLVNWRSADYIPLHYKGWVWMLIVLPLMVTAAAYGYKQYRHRMETDTAFARSRTASNKAAQVLEEAKEASDVKQGYHLIEKALVQYITDKLNLPAAGLSHPQIIDAVAEKADKTVVDELKRLLSKCESIAYAPQTTQKTLASDIGKTEELIKKIGRSV